MKSVEFNEEQLKHLDEIGQALFNDANDPRSKSYARVLNRPKINWFKIACWILLPILVLVGFGFLLVWWNCPILWAIIIPIILWVFFIVCFLKRIVICFVRIYQRYAPESIRVKCRFEPSCSEYMILAIEKYGFIKGFSKGINRLKRCNVNHGGIDMP